MRQKRRYGHDLLALDNPITPGANHRCWAKARRVRAPAAALHVYKSAGVIEVIDAGVGVVHIKATGIHHDFARGVEFHMGAVHGPRRGPFEIDGFGIVTAAVARALELILAGLPLRRATQMSSAVENDEEP